MGLMLRHGHCRHRTPFLCHCRPRAEEGQHPSVLFVFCFRSGHRSDVRPRLRPESYVVLLCVPIALLGIFDGDAQAEFLYKFRDLIDAVIPMHDNVHGARLGFGLRLISQLAHLPVDLYIFELIELLMPAAPSLEFHPRAPIRHHERPCGKLLHLDREYNTDALGRP